MADAEEELDEFETEVCLAGEDRARARGQLEVHVDALLSAATFHFTYNVLRLHKDGIIGWQVVTIPLGMAAFKKLCELMYAKDLLGESPYKCT